MSPLPPTEPVPISALQHYVYCPRQCALIHIEQTFDENIYTLRGRRAHERVDRADDRSVGEGREVRAMPLWSDRLGLIGKADVVEILPDGTAFPVEHKQGPRKVREADDVQVCAQALCLEEMTGRPVPRGAIFHHSSRRRRIVEFTAELRQRTEEVAQATRRLLQFETLPPPVADRRCHSCSLLTACMPFEVARLSGRGS